MLFAPELLLLMGSLVLFFVTLGQGKGKLAKNIALFLAVASSLLSLATLQLEGNLFFNAYRIDLFSQIFKFAMSIGLVAVLIFGSDLKGINNSVRPEYYLFMILSMLGLVMLVSSVELLTLFIALELSSYSLYLMVPMRDDRGGLRMQMEAAIKYILFGAVATATMLYGMSFIYGLTGTTYFTELIPKLHVLASTPTAMLAIALFMTGFFYKLAVFPFHFWVPDVYQGASNSTTAFIASIPKLGAVALLIRITTLVAPNGGESVVMMLMILAVCSMFYGNLSALVQTDVKRMLGFSGIAHAGFVMLGLLTLDDTGFATSMYYITGYLFMNLACFLVICKVSQNGENVVINDFSGLYKRSPLLALTLLVGMMALAGIPPFVGFMGKFMLLTGALKAGHLTLVILAALNTAIAIYYYLSVVRVAFCSAPEERPDVSVDLMTRFVSISLIVVIIVMGVAPKQVLQIATSAVRTIL
ncbi:MAG: NADH-quinone oxidoreductase subunit N [Desulfobulbaceae bacterium DB1]|nr:MAG: NADH-quinone oxidoreductase subunit N [Desulfobulbaceae bacterium DB1]